MVKLGVMLTIVHEPASGLVVEMVNGTADCHLYYTKMDSGPYLEHLRSLTESNRVTHSRTSKLTTRCAIGALSKESGTRNLARKPCARGTGHTRLDAARGAR